MVEMKVVSSYHYYDPVHAYFLVYGIKNNNFSEKIKINPNYEEFDKLNQRVINQKDLEVTAVSAVNLWRIADNYYLLRSGSTQRSDVGPIIVSKKKYQRDEIKDLRIAIPGKSFSGYFYYKLFFNAKEEVVVRFDKIINSVVNGEVDAGLLIPGPTTTALYQKYGLVKIADINDEWK
ncbi:MqnA/MqnD/SBP family protein, partial [Caldisphaera sp.]|uniref:MqnA/MqnD/SBP family protein n=1 Tax=Caldisphaera sp. TaxID=2060322 RepID=UPI003D0CE4A5